MYTKLKWTKRKVILYGKLHISLINIQALSCNFSCNPKNINVHSIGLRWKEDENNDHIARTPEFDM